VGEFLNFLNVSACLTEACEYSTNVSTWLHGDDSELIFFVAPNKEGFVFVMKNSSTFGPVAV